MVNVKILCNYALDAVTKKGWKKCAEFCNTIYEEDLKKFKPIIAEKVKNFVGIFYKEIDVFFFLDFYKSFNLNNWNLC